MLHAGLQTQGQVERHDLVAAGTAAIAPTGERDLTREGHHPARCPAVGAQQAATADVPAGCHQQPLERPDDLRPQLPTDLGESGADRPLQRTDVGALGMQLDGERDRDGDRLHGGPLRVLGSDTSSLRWGSPLPGISVTDVWMLRTCR